MAFWNKSDDPWDRKPGQTPRPPAQETEPEEKPAPLLDRLEGWNEARKAEKAKKEAEQTPASIPCPWCGKPMETGYIMGGRGIWWAPGIPGVKEKWITGPALKQGAWQVDTLGGLAAWQTAWYCGDCQKLAVDCPKPAPDAETQNQEQTEEETGE